MIPRMATTIKSSTSVNPCFFLEHSSKSSQREYTQTNQSRCRAIGDTVRSSAALVFKGVEEVLHPREMQKPIHRKMTASEIDDVILGSQ